MLHLCAIALLICGLQEVTSTPASVFSSFACRSTSTQMWVKQRHCRALVHTSPTAHTYNIYIHTYTYVYSTDIPTLSPHHVAFGPQQSCMTSWEGWGSPQKQMAWWMSTHWQLPCRAEPTGMPGSLVREPGPTAQPPTTLGRLPSSQDERSFISTIECLFEWPYWSDFKINLLIEAFEDVVSS